MAPALTPHEITCLEALRDHGPSSDSEFARDLYTTGRIAVADVAGWRAVRESLERKGFLQQPKPGVYRAAGVPDLVTHPAFPINESGARACNHTGEHTVEACGLLMARVRH